MDLQKESKRFIGVLIAFLLIFCLASAIVAPREIKAEEYAAEIARTKSQAPWVGEWLLLSPGRNPEKITMIPEEHGQMVGIGEGWLLIMSILDGNSGYAICRNGDDIWYGRVEMGQPPEMQNISGSLLVESPEW